MLKGFLALTVGPMPISACCGAASAQPRQAAIAKFDGLAALNKAIRQPMLGSNCLMITGRLRRSPCANPAVHGQCHGLLDLWLSGSCRANRAT